MKRSFAFLAGGLLALAAGSVALLTSLSQAQSKDAAPVSATYLHGVMHLAFAYSAPRGGEGDLIVEAVDPEDGVVGRFDRNVYVTAGHGFREQDLALAGAPAVEDLVWHRLRYRFIYRGDHEAAWQGVIAISRILRHPVVHVLGQQSYLSGGPAAVRLVVTEANNETPVASGSVAIELQAAGGKAQALYRGPLNSRGTTRAQFRFPEGLAGNYILRYAVDTPLGAADHTQQIRLEEKSSVLLTTEKPVYQPGQTIHARALALDRASHEATGNRRLTFEAEDSRGNKIFRAITQTDAYGVASAEFALADEVNLGTWHLRALMDGSIMNGSAGGAASSPAEISLQVERYVLPRFKVDVDLGRKDARAKGGYRPGDHVTGTVRSNYFFGKAVDHAEVAVKALAMDVSLNYAARVEGKTDGDGAFSFDLRLPDFFAGQAMNQGAARVLIEATVKDNAGHSETRGEPVIVSEAPLLVTAVPESGAMIPGLENQVFVLTSYPDGTPAQAEVKVRAPNSPDQTAGTDAGGVAIVRLNGTEQMTKVRIDARDSDGNRASVPVELDSRTGPDPVMLRSERGLYRAGEPIRLQILCARTKGSAYVDVVKDGQTIATHDLDIVNGSAHLEFAATAGMAGTVELNAYVFGRDGRPSGDHRLIFVQPADELRIETTTNVPVYRPGDEARIGFRVTNQRGEGVQAALGLEVVDQAVFALAEKQPGFAKVFFYLEQEMMKPRYEIHSIGLPVVISAAGRGQGDAGQQDRAARALFSATEMTGSNNSSLHFGGDESGRKFAEYSARYRRRLQAQAGQFTAALERADGQSGESCSQTGVNARLAGFNLSDPWGNKLRVSYANWNSGVHEVRSAGPDGQFGTGDDIVDSVQDPWCNRIGFGYSGTVGITFERITGTRGGAQGGLGEIQGTVTDASGAVVAGTATRVLEVASGKTTALKAGADGRFRLTGLHAGRYRIEAVSAGFMESRREFVLAEGIRAVITVQLQIGSVSEMVEVRASAQRMNLANALPAAPMAMAPRGASMAAIAAPESRVVAGLVAAKPAAPETHVRQWFPESLYVMPEIITDKDGRAAITIPIADSITTWRMAMLASTKQGALGSGTASLKVFQDFFAEMDLPVTLTQGDQVSIPVAVYNYSGSRGDVRLRLEQSDWYSLEGDVSDKSLAVETGRVGGSQFTIAARRIGKFKLTLRAEMEGGAKRADIVVREIEVVPDGREQNMVFNGRLDSAAQHEVNFPAAAVPDASTVFVRLYPGPLSQVVEGMDSLLRMPFGCFEQTSSSTYPNVLALDYIKRTKKLTPEVSAKAQGYIATGYQRLVTFEVPGGGFSWFGTAPANKILTSYGLMEFSDMAKVHDVDQKVIQRTQQWLAQQQQADGSWKPDNGGINEGATNRFQSDVLRITAYVAWALETTGYQGSGVDRARQYIETHAGGSKADAYTLAVLANFAADYGKDRAFTAQAMRMLLDARTEQGDQAFWKAEQTGMYGGGISAAVETTGLAVQALLKWGAEPALAAKAMNYIVAKKDSQGTWGTTQATIMALRALLLSTQRGSGTATGTVEVLLNGKVAEKLALTADNNDLFHQLAFKGTDTEAANRVEIRFDGEGSLAYQVAGRYFVPWNQKPESEALSIDVSYDRTRLEQDQIAIASATVRNRLTTTANMVMVDLGIPPGFELLSEDLDSYRERSTGKKSGRLEKFTLTPTQAILYFDSISPNDAIRLQFRLRAKYPVRARTFASRVYEYYDPEVSSVARPVQLEVRRK
jgi:hypothetical protein